MTPGRNHIMGYPQADIESESLPTFTPGRAMRPTKARQLADAIDALGVRPAQPGSPRAPKRRDVP